MKSQSTIIVRYAETDQMGIVHHSVYPVWYEAARTEFIKKLGITYTQMEQLGILLPVAEVTCRYFFPAHYEDELTVTVSVKNMTPARIEFAYVVTKPGRAKPINTGTTLHAFAGTDLRPMNMKKKFPELYRKIEAAYLEET